MDFNVQNQKHEHSAAIPPQKRSYVIAKRVLDFICALTASIVLSPLLLIIALVVKLDSKGPVIFKHKRVGQYGKPVYIYKFRTMYENAQEMIKDFTPEQMEEWLTNFKLEDDPRITRVGHFLRKSSMDELPQLFNILKGELSVVGPRPVPQDEVDLYGEDSEKFLSVMPGLTGYWQAYARSDCTYEVRREMELYYVDHANLWWDIKIVFATVGAVLSAKGAK